MKVKQKLMISVVFILFVFMSLNVSEVNAALQANGGSGKVDTIGNWLLNIRRMETAGGTLGLQDTINTTNLTSSADKSNNLDIHMEKNTEYGAMAILSASAYGNQNKINSGETTTGNKTGIYMYLNNEWVAAGTISAHSGYKNAASKYKNVAGRSYVQKIGDAITETQGWHGSTTSSWLYYWSSYSGEHAQDYAGLLRSCAGSIFSYNGNAGNWTAGKETILNAYYTKAWSSRAVIVVGKDF